jgi:hypothetical protein
MNKPACTCGMALGLAVMVGHLCPVHYRESFVLGQHPLHSHSEEPTRSQATLINSMVPLASGSSALSVNLHEDLSLPDEAIAVILVNPTQIEVF